MTTFISANIPHGESHPFIGAAAYLSWVAYPSKDEINDGALFTEACVALAMKSKGKHLPAHLKLKKETAISRVHKGLNRIAKRRVPALWLAAKIMGRDSRWPMGMPVSHACDLICDPDGAAASDLGAIIKDGDPKNISGRIWYETLPALGMVLALPLFDRDPYKSTGLPELLRSPEWVGKAVTDAALVAPKMAAKFNAKNVFVPVFR